MKKPVFQKESGQRGRKKRITLVIGFFLFGFAVLVYRCFWLHVTRDHKLERIAKSQYQTKVEEVPPRGNIYDAAGEELAISVPASSVAVRPPKIKDVEKAVKDLNAILKIPVKELQEKLSGDKKYVWLKRFLSPREKDDLTTLQMDALELVKGAKRFYPNREVASQILGAVGLDNEGLSGLELFYDRYLKGEAEDATTYRDARGKMFETEETLTKDVQDPHHLHLTIRKNIQYVAEKEINETCQSHSAKSCTAVVLDPHTGAVLAMASYPSFNPNSYQSYDVGLWRNLAVTDTFEPGSTFKTILASSALEHGAVKAGDKFFCENGDLQVGDHVIHDHERYGMLSVRDIIKVSSNIGIYKVGRKLGKKDFAETVDLFGFGKRLGIDYPGEVPGYVRPVKSWQEIDFANISFGQGVRVTPLQLVSAYATIANRGVRLRPYLVSKVTGADGHTILENGPKEEGRVLREDTSRLIIDIMKGVTTEGGTATKAALPGYTVAGKTGTAQKVIGGEYSHTKFVASFVGIVPADDPQLVVLVVVDEPKGEIYGGLVAAPVFRKIAWAALTDMGVPPEKPGMPITTVTDAGHPPKAGGGGNTRRSEPEGAAPKPAEAALLTVQNAGFSVPAKTGSVAGALPDFRGLSKRKVLALLDERHLSCRVIGSGVAEAQVPSPGSPAGGADCRIYFKEE